MFCEQNCGERCEKQMIGVHSVTTTSTGGGLCVPYSIYGISGPESRSKSFADETTFYQHGYTIHPTFPRPVYTYRPSAEQPHRRHVISQTGVQHERLEADVASTPYGRYDHSAATPAPPPVENQPLLTSSTSANDQLHQPHSCRLSTFA